MLKSEWPIEKWSSMLHKKLCNKSRRIKSHNIDGQTQLIKYKIQVNELDFCGHLLRFREILKFRSENLRKIQLMTRAETNITFNRDSSLLRRDLRYI